MKGIEDLYLRMELDIYLAVVFPGERIKYSGHALIANRDKCSCYMTLTLGRQGCLHDAGYLKYSRRIKILKNLSFPAASINCLTNVVALVQAFAAGALVLDWA